VTIFLGCGFAAKYREGGGNLSVPLQWMLGLRRLKLDAIWLELLPATNDARADQVNIDNFQRRLREHGLGGRYCLLFQKSAGDVHDLDEMRCIGMSKRELLDRLDGPNALLNLSYSIHPPLLLQFERRIFCDLDPSEIFFWMTKMEMGNRSTTNSGRSVSTSTDMIAGCRDRRFVGRHFIRWWIRNWFAVSHGRAYRSSRRLVNGIGAGAWKLTVHFPIFPKKLHSSLISICPSASRKRASSWQ